MDPADRCRRRAAHRVPAQGRTAERLYALTTDCIDPGEIGVTQHFLHSTQIGVPVQHGRLAGRSARVRRGHRSTVEDASHITRCQRATRPIEEQQGRPYRR